MALRSRGYDEICRVIRETDPPTPSKRFSGLRDVVEVSKNRHVEPSALGKLLRGDLDWVVMKCLEKDRSRRYETVHGLARDIERHLSDEPVRARPPSAAYRLKKLVRKHRVATVAACGEFFQGQKMVVDTVPFARASRTRRGGHGEREIILAFYQGPGDGGLPSADESGDSDQGDAQRRSPIATRSSSILSAGMSELFARSASAKRMYADDGSPRKSAPSLSIATSARRC